jgi:ribosomal protein S27AE
MVRGKTKRYNVNYEKIFKSIKKCPVCNSTKIITSEEGIRCKNCNYENIRKV